MATKYPPLPDMGDRVVQMPGNVLDPEYYLFLKGLRDKAAAEQTVFASTAPIASAIPEGEARDWHNTATNTTVRAINIGGVVKTITYT
jgi:hypothetical protein